MRVTQPLAPPHGETGGPSPSLLRRILAWLGTAVATGIVGALAFNALDKAFASAQQTVSVALWVIITGVLFFLAIAVYQWWRARQQITDLRSQYDAAIVVANNVIGLDDTLLRLLPGLVGTPRSRQAAAMQKLLEELLRDASRVFGANVSRAMLVRPNETGECLTPWVSYQMPTDSIRRTSFYIGPDQGRKHGIAGVSFLECTLKVVHFSQDETGKWVADDPEYQDFEPKRPHPPYRSFVTVPIVGATPDCLGVLCIDSMHPTAFDSPGTQDLARVLGKRIAAAMLIYQQMQVRQTANRGKGLAG